MVTYNGVLIGSQQLNELKGNEGIIVKPVLDVVPRMYQMGDGEVSHNAFKPSSVKIDSFSCGELGCAPGYVEYFNKVIVRDYQIVE